LALHCRLLPRHRFKQFHIDGQRVFIAGEASSSVRLAHGWQSNFRHNLRTVDWIHPRPDRILPDLHSLAKRLHFNMHLSVVDWIHHEVFEAKGKETDPNRDYIILSKMKECMTNNYDPSLDHSFPLWISSKFIFWLHKF